MPEPENPTAEAPAQTAPATPAFDPEAFKASLLAEWEAKTNERISGVQSSFQKLLNEREEEIRQLKTASMSEDEREQLAEQEAAEYVEQLERQVWLANEASKKYPKAAAHIQKLFEAGGDVAAYAEYLESVLNPAPATPEPDPAEQVPDVDPNNPPRTTSAGAFVLPNGQVLTEELARQTLAAFGDMPVSQVRGG